MPLLEQVLEKNPDKIKIAFKHFPLKMHKSALAAAAASLYADSEGKFAKFHRLLGDNYKVLDEAKILDIAENVGLGREKVELQFRNPVWLKKIQNDISDGKKAGVKGIPKVFINGRSLKNRTLKEFQRLIDLEMQKNRK